MKHPTCTKIAEDFGLWQEYADPEATMTEDEFDAMTTGKKVELIHSLWPEDCNCEE